MLIEHIIDLNILSLPMLTWIPKDTLGWSMHAIRLMLTDVVSNTDLEQQNTIVSWF